MNKYEIASELDDIVSALSKIQRKAEVSKELRSIRGPLAVALINLDDIVRWCDRGDEDEDFSEMDHGKVSAYVNQLMED